MTLFEFLAIAFSLVFSFAALRLISGLPYALEPGRRYSVHVAHVFIILISTTAVFWTFWSFREIQWNWFLFLSGLAGPGLLYFLACTLIPDAPSAVESWRDHYYKMRRRYFVGICVWALLMSLNATLFANIPLLHPVRSLYLLILTGGVVGAVSEDPRVHAGMLVGALIGIVIFSVLLFRPGALAV